MKKNWKIDKYHKYQIPIGQEDRYRLEYNAQEIYKWIKESF
jgi:hypothetical protein